MSGTKRSLERLWSGDPTPEDIVFAGGPEAAAAMRNEEWAASASPPQQPEPASIVWDGEDEELYECIECGARTARPRLCVDCYVRDKWL